MKGFVAGATGLTGREVVAGLVERGHQAVAHVRPDSSRLDEWRERFGSLGAQTDATAWEAQAMTQQLKALQPDAVFATLGTTRKRARAAAKEGADATYEAVDYGLTVLLIDACVAAGIRPRFVYLSSMGVREGAVGAYLQARWRVEEHLRATGLPYTIARPSFILGERDDHRPFEAVGAGIGNALLALAGGLGARRLQDRYRSISGADLGRALVRLAEDPAAVGQVVSADGLREPSEN